MKEEVQRKSKTISKYTTSISDSVYLVLGIISGISAGYLNFPIFWDPFRQMRVKYLQKQ